MFTRFHDDDARITKRLQQSTDVGRYMLNVPGMEELPYVNDPQWRMTHWGANLRSGGHPESHPIDIDSDLMGLTRNSNKDCISNEYKRNQVHTKENTYKTVGGLTDESRATHPAWMYRDLEQTRWYPLHLNPQEHTCIPFHNNMSSRIIEKDNYTIHGKC